MQRLLKDPAVIHFLVQLNGALDPDGWDVVDLWEMDPRSVGIASARDGRVVVRVSPLPEGTDGYRYQCLLLGTPPAMAERAVQEGQAGFEEVVDLIAAHLARGWGS